MTLVELLEWDSSFFGFPIGRVKDEIRTGQVESAVREADERGIRCTYLLVPADDQALLDAAQKHGFLVRDVRVELDRAVAGHATALNGLRHADLQDLATLRPIARERFQRTRFFADPGFSAERCADLYVEWLSRALRGEPGWKALMTEDARGFIVCELNPQSSVGAIVLIGVATSATRQGLGSSLVSGAGSLFLDASLLKATVVTQGHNVAAQRLYQAHGYRISRVDYWLHRWMSH